MLKGEAQLVMVEVEAIPTMAAKKAEAEGTTTIPSFVLFATNQDTPLMNAIPSMAFLQDTDQEITPPSTIWPLLTLI